MCYSQMVQGASEKPEFVNKGGTTPPKSNALLKKLNWTNSLLVCAVFKMSGIGQKGFTATGFLLHPKWRTYQYCRNPFKTLMFLIKWATIQKNLYECWEYVHFEMKSKRNIVIPWSMPDLSGEQHNLFFAVKSLLVSELNKDNVLFGRKPCKKQ